LKSTLSKQGQKEIMKCQRLIYFSYSYEYINKYVFVHSPKMGVDF
jgi:hypothetical protein